MSLASLILKIWTVLAILASFGVLASSRPVQDVGPVGGAKVKGSPLATSGPNNQTYVPVSGP